MSSFRSSAWGVLESSRRSLRPQSQMRRGYFLSILLPFCLGVQGRLVLLLSCYPHFLDQSYTLEGREGKGHPQIALMGIRCAWLAPTTPPLRPQKVLISQNFNPVGVAKINVAYNISLCTWIPVVCMIYACCATFGSDARTKNELVLWFMYIDYVP